MTPEQFTQYAQLSMTEEDFIAYFSDKSENYAASLARFLSAVVNYDPAFDTTYVTLNLGSATPVYYQEEDNPSTSAFIAENNNSKTFVVLYEDIFYHDTGEYVIIRGINNLTCTDWYMKYDDIINMIVEDMSHAKAVQEFINTVSSGVSDLGSAVKDIINKFSNSFSVQCLAGTFSTIVNKVTDGTAALSEYVIGLVNGHGVSNDYTDMVNYTWYSPFGSMLGINTDFHLFGIDGIGAQVAGIVLKIAQLVGRMWSSLYSYWKNSWSWANKTLFNKFIKSPPITGYSGNGYAMFDNIGFVQAWDDAQNPDIEDWFTASSVDEFNYFKNHADKQLMINVPGGRFIATDFSFDDATLLVKYNLSFRPRYNEAMVSKAFEYASEAADQDVGDRYWYASQIDSYKMKDFTPVVDKVAINDTFSDDFLEHVNNPGILTDDTYGAINAFTPAAFSMALTFCILFGNNVLQDNDRMLFEEDLWLPNPGLVLDDNGIDIYADVQENYVDFVHPQKIAPKLMCYHDPWAGLYGYMHSLMEAIYDHDDLEFWISYRWFDSIPCLLHANHAEDYQGDWNRTKRVLGGAAIIAGAVALGVGAYSKIVTQAMWFQIEAERMMYSADYKGTKREIKTIRSYLFKSKILNNIFKVFNGSEGTQEAVVETNDTAIEDMLRKLDRKI